MSGIIRKRYFLVSYIYQDDNGRGYGTTLIETEGRYVGQAEIKKRVKKIVKSKKSIILNLVEMSESDYEDFLRN